MAADMSQIRSGWDVYGSDGEKVGTVGDVGSNYLLVTKGFLFTKDIYIPMSAITGIEQDRAYINVSKDQVENMGWDRPPEDTGYDTAGYGTTGVSTYTDEDSTTVTTQGVTSRSGRREEPVQGSGYAEQSTQQSTGTDNMRIQRFEEELRPETVERDAGEVRVSKDVVEEERTLEVPVTREEVQVRSVTPSETTADTSQAFQQDTFSVPVREEEVQVRKETRVAEELEIEKTAVQDTERVRDTVRKEVVDVDRAGDVDIDRNADTRQSFDRDR